MSDLPKMKCHEMKTVGAFLMLFIVAAIIVLYGSVILKSLLWILGSAVTLLIGIVLYNIFGTQQVACPWDNQDK